LKLQDKNRSNFKKFLIIVQIEAITAEVREKPVEYEK